MPDAPPSPAPATDQYPVPGWARALVGGLSLATALWGLVGVVAAAFLAGTPVWTALGFEVVVVVAGVLGVLLGLGRFREAPALGVLCVAGVFGVASILEYTGSSGDLAGIPLRPWMLARIAIAAILAGVAALLVLQRDRRSWGMLVKAGVLGAVPGVAALVFALAAIGYGRPLPTPASPTTQAPTTQATATSAPVQAGRSPAIVDNAVRAVMNSPLLRPAKGLGEALRIVGLTLLGIVLIGLTSASAHFAIHAFLLGHRAGTPGKAAALPAAASAGSPAS
ncbi:MAG: hypothetical protein R3B68_06590 [Phycisphaerales bacterium]